MGTNMKHLVVLPLLLLAHPASAQEWIEITTSQSGSVYTVDPEQIRVGEETSTAWMKIDHSNDRTERARYSMVFLRINCAERTYRELTRVSYRADGSTLKQSSQPDMHVYVASLYEPAVPGSVGYRLVTTICEYLGK